MADLTYPLYPTFAFLGFILSLIPLPWHLQAWNSGTCYFMMWSALACLNQFINSVVWAGNALNPAPAWCEICKPTSCTFFYSPDGSTQPFELWWAPPLESLLLLFVSIADYTTLLARKRCLWVAVRYDPYLFFFLTCWKNFSETARYLDWHCYLRFSPSCLRGPP